jgi:Zn-dependent protease/CBS domain-containing protein
VIDMDHVLPAPSAVAPRRPARRSWSWRIGTIAGIELHVHISLLVILGWLFFAQLALGHGTEHALISLALLVAVFAIVVVHELAHALVARRYGCATRDITLWAIGGVARLERVPDRPRHELAVALAGPAVNLVLAAVLALALALAGGSLDPEALGESGGSFATKLLWVNVSLAVFNLIPAFPMDGGRVLRAILAMRYDRVRATAIAARVGQRLAWVFGALGLLYNPMLLVIAVFVWIAAAAESSTVHIETALAREAVSAAMLPDPHVVPRDLALGELAELALSTSQSVFPVVDEEGRLVGAIDRGDLVRGLATAGTAAGAGAVMRRDVTMAGAGEPLLDVMRRMASDHAVVIDGAARPIGLLTSEAIARFAAIRGALRARSEA